MDSLTQVALGAAVGEAVGGKQAGWKAPLWGAGLGTLPDLDVLADPFLTETQALVFHRSLTHSFLFAALVTLVAGWGLRQLHKEASLGRWMALVAAVLLTHIGLDCLTSYGTQVFWPFSSYPVILGTVFVIDPAYTVPLAAGLLASFWWEHQARPRRLANYVGLGLSCLYLLFTIGNKLYVNQVFADALEEQGYSVTRTFTKPTPFNNLLWMVIAEGENAFYVGYYSLLDEDTTVTFDSIPKLHHLLGNRRNDPVVKTLRRFARDYFVIRRGPDGSLYFIDLRFGRNDVGLTNNGTYLFRFRLLETASGHVVGIRPVDPSTELSAELLRRFAWRILGQADGCSRCNADVTRDAPLHN